MQYGNNFKFIGKFSCVCFSPIVSLTIVFGVKIRNGIPQILKKRPKKAYKRSLMGTLLDVLQTEDSNIDVDNIIVKMKK